MRGRKQLPPEANPEHRHVINVGLTQHGELWQHPRPNGFMIIDRPRSAHGDDHIEVRRLWELCLDVGRLEATLRHDLVYGQVITAGINRSPTKPGVQMWSC